jgi:HSP20 family protein
MQKIQHVLLSSEVRDFTEEVGRLFDDLDRSAGASRRAPPGRCTPALDVQETVDALEVVVDLPGVTAEHVRVLIKNAVLVLVGEKPSPYPAGPGDATFHVVERSFGRFARAVKLEGAVDAGRARAVLSGGELRVSIPKLDERRGKDILVPVASA